MLKMIKTAIPATDNDIRALEDKFKIKLPLPYVEFLQTSNGGQSDRDFTVVPGCKESPYARIHFFHGIGYPLECYDLAWSIEVFADRLPTDIIPIATTEGADLFCLNLTTGGVVFWDGWDHTIYPLADSFKAFLDSLSAEEPLVEGEPSGTG